MAFSGIIMYITPVGRVAYWSDWRMFGMNKTMYNETHITMSMLFLASMVLHIWLNWKPIVSYMKSNSGKVIVFTKETMIGLVLAVVFIVGTLNMTAPFSSILDALGNIKEDYEYSLGNPPYPHAELTTLSAFIKRMQFDEAKAEDVLKNAGIKYTMEENLKTIATNHGTDPAYIYELLKPTVKADAEEKPLVMYEGVQQGVDMSKYESLTGSGMGQKSIKSVAEQLGIPLATAMERLNKYNIEANENDKLKEVGNNAGIMPMDVYIIIDSGVKPE